MLFVVIKPLKLLRRWVSSKPEDMEGLSRDVKLRRLLSYARAHLVMDVVTWHRAMTDPRLAGARQSIGSIYRVRIVGSRPIALR